MLQSEIGKYFKLKESLIGLPDIYLGGKVNKCNVCGTDGDVPAWSFSSSQYVQIAMSNVEKYLQQVKHIAMLRSMDVPITNGY